MFFKIFFVKCSKNVKIQDMEKAKKVVHKIGKNGKKTGEKKV